MNHRKKLIMNIEVHWSDDQKKEQQSERNRSSPKIDIGRSEANELNPKLKPAINTWIEWDTSLKSPLHAWPTNPKIEITYKYTKRHRAYHKYQYKGEKL